MGEFLVSKEGIGYLIMYGSQVFNLDLVMSGVIILGVVATVMYYAVNFVEKKLLKRITSITRIEASRPDSNWHTVYDELFRG